MVDIWSVGIVLYAALSGTLPYDEKDVHRAEEIVRNLKCMYAHERWADISREAIDLISNRLLVVQPMSRIRSSVSSNAHEHHCATNESTCIFRMPSFTRGSRTFTCTRVCAISRNELSSTFWPSKCNFHHQQLGSRENARIRFGRNSKRCTRNHRMNHNELCE